MYRALLKIALGIFLLSFIGISYDDEFYEPDFFVKHRPSLQLKFKSATGQSDLTLQDLSVEARKQQLLYQEFVVDQKRDFLDNLTLFLIPLTSLLILSGLLQLTSIISRKADWRHFLAFYGSCFLLFIISGVIVWNYQADGFVVSIIYAISCIAAIVKLDRIFKRWNLNRLNS